jgi:hypothetical protein
MRRAMTGLASLAGVLLLVGLVVGGLYVRSLHTPAVVGQADASPSPTESSDTPTPIVTPSPSPTQVASPIAPSPSPAPRPPANLSPHPVPTCPPEVIRSFTATAGPRSVILSWTVTGGCGDETGWFQGSFGTHSQGTTMYPGLWVIPIHRAWKTYTDHPVKPANAGQVCLFSLTYYLGLNGTAPDGQGVPLALAEVFDVNLC